LDLSHGSFNPGAALRHTVVRRDFLDRLPDVHAHVATAVTGLLSVADPQAGPTGEVAFSTNDPLPCDRSQDITLVGVSGPDPTPQP